MSDSFYICRWGITTTGCCVAIEFVPDLLYPTCGRETSTTSGTKSSRSDPAQKSVIRFVQKAWTQAAKDTSLECIMTYSSCGDQLYPSPVRPKLARERVPVQVLTTRTTRSRGCRLRLYRHASLALLSHPPRRLVRRQERSV